MVETVERNVHQGGSRGQAVKRPPAKASFDARRLASFRKLLAASLADGSSTAYVDQVEDECRRLATGLIAGEQVQA